MIINKRKYIQKVVSLFVFCILLFVSTQETFASDSVDGKGNECCTAATEISEDDYEVIFIQELAGMDGRVLELITYRFDSDGMLVVYIPTLDETDGIDTYYLNELNRDNMRFAPCNPNISSPHMSQYIVTGYIRLSQPPWWQVLCRWCGGVGWIRR